MLQSKIIQMIKSETKTSLLGAFTNFNLTTYGAVKLTC